MAHSTICPKCYRRDCTKHPQTETPPRADTSKYRFTSKIETTEQADKAIREVTGTLYALAGLDFLVFVLLFRKPLFLVDVFFLLAMGFVLKQSRSRSVAVVVAGYAMVSGLVALLSRLGLYTGTSGTNVILGALVAFAAFRGVYATFVFQREQRTKANVRGVILLSVTSTFLSAVAFAAVIVIALVAGYDLEQDADSNAVGPWLIAGIVLPWFLVFGRVLPFIRQLRVVRPASESSEHFDAVDSHRGLQ
jgi:hypothetical protein